MICDYFYPPIVTNLAPKRKISSPKSAVYADFGDICHYSHSMNDSIYCFHKDFQAQYIACVFFVFCIFFVVL